MKGFTFWDDSPFSSFLAQGQTDLEVFVKKLLNRSDPEATRSVAAGPRLHAMRSTKGPLSRGPASLPTRRLKALPYPAWRWGRPSMRTALWERSTATRERQSHVEASGP